MPKVNGHIVKTAMARAGMKRSDLAAATRIEPRTLTNALGANRHNLDDSKIYAICEALGLAYEQVVSTESERGAA